MWGDSKDLIMFMGKILICPKVKTSFVSVNWKLAEGKVNTSRSLAAYMPN